MDRANRDRCAVVCPVGSARPRPWRCQSCGALLGMEDNGELCVKYKELQHWIRGTCRQRCRRCGAMNVLHVAVGTEGGR